MISDLEGLESQDNFAKKPRVLVNTFLGAAIRFSHIVLAFTILLLALYVVKVFGGDYGHTLALSIAAFLWTDVLMIYIIFVYLRNSRLYQIYIHIGFEIISVALWIAAFSLFVQECQAWDARVNAASQVFGAKTVASMLQFPGQDAAIRSLRAATWLSGLTTVLASVTFLARVLYQIHI